MLTKDFAPYYILLIVFADNWTSLLRDPFTTNFFSQQTLFSTLQSKSLKRRKSLGLFFFILKTVIRWNFSIICIRTFWWDNSTDSYQFEECHTVGQTQTCQRLNKNLIHTRCLFFVMIYATFSSECLWMIFNLSIFLFSYS